MIYFRALGSPFLKLITLTFESNRIGKIVAVWPFIVAHKNTPVTFDRGFILILSSGSNQPAMELLILRWKKGRTCSGRKGGMERASSRTLLSTIVCLYFFFMFSCGNYYSKDRRSLCSLSLMERLTQPKASEEQKACHHHHSLYPLISQRFSWFDIECLPVFHVLNQGVQVLIFE